jgi:hypothetical protein
MWILICDIPLCDLRGQEQEVHGEYVCCAICNSIYKRP